MREALFCPDGQSTQALGRSGEDNTRIRNQESRCRCDEIPHRYPHNRRSHREENRITQNFSSILVGSRMVFRVSGLENGHQEDRVSDGRQKSKTERMARNKSVKKGF